MSNTFWIERLRNKLSTPLGHALIQHRSTDAYIAAFPRSGSTWLRTMLVNILEPSAKGNPDSFNARIPAVSIRNAKNINKLSDPRIIMSHSQWRPSINKAVYLVRDGRDAFISYYHYQTTRNGIDMDINRFYQLYKAQTYGLCWEQHIESWLTLGRSRLDNDFHLVRFEMMKEQPVQTVLDVCEFLNIITTAEDVTNAVDNASLDRARSIERQRQGELAQADASFYRQGSSKQWQEQKYQKVITRFLESASSSLELAGYEDLN